MGLEMLGESAGILESLAACPARVVTPTRLLVHCQLMLPQVHLKQISGKLVKKQLESLATGPAGVITPTQLLVHSQLMISQVHLNRSGGKISQ